jgi:hypothetical protein
MVKLIKFQVSYRFIIKLYTLDKGLEKCQIIMCQRQLLLNC